MRTSSGATAQQGDGWRYKERVVPVPFCFQPPSSLLSPVRNIAPSPPFCFRPSPLQPIFSIHPTQLRALLLTTSRMSATRLLFIASCLISFVLNLALLPSFIRFKNISGLIAVFWLVTSSSLFGINAAFFDNASLLAAPVYCDLGKCS